MEQQANQSNFSVVTTTKSKKGGKTGLIISALIVLFLAISIPAGVYLVKQQQDIREKAEEALVCPAAEACPVAGESALLRSCNTVANGEPPEDISCSTIANVLTTADCGGTTYCCPSLGAAWTTDVTLCASPTATPTSTPSPSPTESPDVSPTPTDTPDATPTATSTANPSGSPSLGTATPTGTPSATLAPIPVSGTSWPTIVGAGVGILVIIGSILLVL